MILCYSVATWAKGGHCGANPKTLGHVVFLVGTKAYSQSSVEEHDKNMIAVGYTKTFLYETNDYTS